MATSIFGENTAVNDQLNSLFKNSAGPSAVATVPEPISQSNVSKLFTSKLSKRKQQKLMLERAEAGIAKARALSSLPELRKRKVDALENEEKEEEGKEEQKDTAAADTVTVPKKKSRAATKEEEREKNERSVFVGNVPVSCTEKPGIKEFKRKFAEYGVIESLRFRSVAFSEKMTRKAAFIKKKLHNSRSVANAYIVYQDKASVEKALAMNGQLFMEKHLRVDSVTNPKPHDRKRSVFVGSLPFDTEEEELWEFFKDCGDIEYVRIVRDKATNVGKGIAYVQFTRRNIVDMALALDDKKFREKHTLRIQRCKAADSLPTSAQPVNNKKKNKAPSLNVPGKKPRAQPATKKSSSGKSALPLSAKFEGARSSKAVGNKFKTGKTMKSPKNKFKFKRKHK